MNEEYLLTDEEMQGIIWENGACLDSEEGREPTQTERFNWIAKAQIEKMRRLQAEQTPEKVREELAMTICRFCELTQTAFLGKPKCDSCARPCIDVRDYAKAHVQPLIDRAKKKERERILDNIRDMWGWDLCAGQPALAIPLQRWVDYCHTAGIKRDWWELEHDGFKRDKPRLAISK